MSANLPSLRPLFSCMTTKDGSRPSILPADGFDTHRGIGFRYFRSKSKGFERVEPAREGHVASQSGVNIPASAVWEGMDDGADVSMQHITVTTRIEQEVGLGGME